MEEIFDRTPPATLQKIYNLPEFGSTLEFLTMLALSGGRLLKVYITLRHGTWASNSLIYFIQGGTPDLNSSARQVLNDWNQQKIPYFSEPPAIHPSLIPSVGKLHFFKFYSNKISTLTYTVHSNVNSNVNATPIIAPGAENVGQAQILSEYSKPFHLEGLFGDADAGAFGARRDEDCAMLADEDGDIFWDAVEDHEAMDEDG